MTHKEQSIARVKQLLAEQTRRQKESLRVYRPDSRQLPFHESKAARKVVRGGKRCSAEGTIVWLIPEKRHGRWSAKNPKPVCIEDVNVGDRIVGFNFRPTRCFQGAAEVLEKSEFTETGYQLVTKRGYTTTGTHDHPVWCCPPTAPRYHNSIDPDRSKGQWKLLREIPAGWYVKIGLGPYREDVESDDDAYFRGLMDGDGNTTRPYGVMRYTSHVEESDLRSWITSYVRSKGVDGSVGEYPKQQSLGVSTEWCNLEFKEWYMANSQEPTPEVMKGYIQGLMDAEGHFCPDGGKIIIEMVDVDKIRLLQQWLLLFGIKSSFRLKRPNPGNRQPSYRGRLLISGASATAYINRIGFRHEKKKAESEAYDRSTAIQKSHFWDRVAEVNVTEPVKFIAIKTSTETYISNGIYSHNSGKTVAVASEFASACLGIPITREDGTLVTGIYPKPPILAWVIGWGVSHIGQTIHRVLFEPGYIRVIKDLQTGEYRTFNPAKDKARADEAEPAEPLIPSRLIKRNGWSWDDKAQKVFNTVELLNGTKICAFPSTAPHPKQGDAVDLIWIDEDIRWSGHLDEWEDRCRDKNGKIIWSVWPHATNEALIDWLDRAEEQKDWEKPIVSEVRLSMSTNPFIDPEAIRTALDDMKDDDARASRDHGEIVFGKLLIYDFSKELHGLPSENTDPVSQIYRECGGQFPRSWTRYMALDPSHTRTAALFAVVPPPEWDGKRLYDNKPIVIIEDELVLERKGATGVAQMVRDKIGTKVYEAFIIDKRMGRQTHAGRTFNVKRLYADAFEACGVRSNTTDSSFAWGCDDWKYRQDLVRDMMRDEGEAPRLRFVLDKTPKLQKEIPNYRKRMIPGEEHPRDEPAKGTHDLLDCLEYLIAHKLEYVTPDPEKDKNSVWARVQRMKNKKPQSSIHFGMGSGEKEEGDFSWR